MTVKITYQPRRQPMHCSPECIVSEAGRWPRPMLEPEPGVLDCGDMPTPSTGLVSVSADITPSWNSVSSRAAKPYPPCVCPGDEPDPVVLVQGHIRSRTGKIGAIRFDVPMPSMVFRTLCWIELAACAR